MRTMLRFCGSLLLASVVLAAAIVAAWLVWGAPFDHAVININGDELSLAQLHGGHGLAAVGGMAVGLLVVLLVVPVAVIVPLLFVALVLVVVFAVLAGVAALVFWPVFLLAALVWLIWRLARRGDKPAAGVAP